MPYPSPATLPRDTLYPGLALIITRPFIAPLGVAATSAPIGVTPGAIAAVTAPIEMESEG